MPKFEKHESRVYTGPDALDQLDQLLGMDYSGRKKFVLLDANTHQHCLARLVLAVAQLANCEVIEVGAGEESKSTDIAAQLWKVLLDMGADRQSVLFNLGGGMISDLGGFVASTFKRGIPFINLPTSLLGMVDASIGGKTGVNLGNIKNQVGSFSDADYTFVFPPFLHTLPERELVSGWAEMAKHGLALSVEHWNEIKLLDPKAAINSPQLIHDSIMLKNEVVKADPHEQGYRKVLNFGHTIGHALETLSFEKSLPLLHGEAVALGMIAALKLSVDHSTLPQKDADEAVAYLHTNFPKFLWGTSDTKRLLEIMEYDKKSKDGEFRFVLLSAIGKAKSDCVLSEEEVSQSLEYLREMMQ